MKRKTTDDETAWNLECLETQPASLLGYILSFTDLQTVLDASRGRLGRKIMQKVNTSEVKRLLAKPFRTDLLNPFGSLREIARHLLYSFLYCPAETSQGRVSYVFYQLKNKEQTERFPNLDFIVLRDTCQQGRFTLSEYGVSEERPAATSSSSFSMLSLSSPVDDSFGSKWRANLRGRQEFTGSTSSFCPNYTELCSALKTLSFFAYDGLFMIGWLFGTRFEQAPDSEVRGASPFFFEEEPAIPAHWFVARKSGWWTPIKGRAVDSDSWKFHPYCASESLYLKP